MRDSFSSVVRLCLIGLLLEFVLSSLGLALWSSILGCVPFLWGTMRLRTLHDGFSSAFWLSVIRLLLIGAGAIPPLRSFVWESVWSLLIPLCLWLALACFADGFWAVRLSRGLCKNRSAAAVVFLQILLASNMVRSSLPLLITAGLLFFAALWYYDRAARELAMCEDPPTIS